jgi:hypothetical protein
MFRSRHLKIGGASLIIKWRVIRDFWSGRLISVDIIMIEGNLDESREGGIVVLCRETLKLVVEDIIYLVKI